MLSFVRLGLWGRWTPDTEDPMGSIAILVHKNDRFEAMHYFLHAISEIWRESGWEMRVLQGPQGKISADLAILHVDLIRVFNRYLKYLEQFPKVLNG